MNRCLAVVFKLMLAILNNVDDRDQLIPDSSYSTRCCKTLVEMSAAVSDEALKNALKQRRKYIETNLECVPKPLPVSDL